MLGSRGFNAQLNDTQRRFTYFVPRDYAWNRLQIDYPSLHKKLFMRDFAYHVSLVTEKFNFYFYDIIKCVGSGLG